MIDNLLEFVGVVLGLDQDKLTFWQMAIRALIVYASAVAMVRLGEKRFLGRNTAFDVILGIVLGSVISRAITGSAPFFPTVGAGFVLVGLHWAMAAGSFHLDWLGTLIKGSERELVKEGEILWDEMQKSHISKKDLMGALRMNGSSELDSVKSAHFERSGDISFITKDKEVCVKEISVHEGVQTVRIEIG